MSAKTAPLSLTNVSVEKAEDGTATLHIEVSPDSVRARREKVIKDYSRRLKLPGFRPGHVPAHMVRRNVGDEAIAQTVSDELVPLAYQQALVQSALQPLERAQVDDLTFDAFDGEKPLQFTARVIVRPEFEVPDISGLQITRPDVEVTDEDIEQGLERMRTERAPLTNVEGRGAQEGDVLTADLTVIVDGQPRSEEPHRMRAFVLGESGFVPSIDEHLVGAQLDEERQFSVTYPDDFHEADFAGKEAEFKVKVISLKERILPEVNDEFAQSMGTENLEELRDRMRQFIRFSREREMNDKLRQEIASVVAEGTELEVPGSLIDSRLHRRIHNLEHELEHRQSTLEKYLEETNSTREEMESKLREEITAELRRDLVLDEIARRENLQVSQQEIEQQYMMMASTFQQPVETLVENIDVNSVRASILQRKAVDWLYEHTQILDTAGNPIAKAESADEIEADETEAAEPEVAEPVEQNA